MRIPLHLKLMGTYILVVALIGGPTLWYVRRTLRTGMAETLRRDLTLEATSVRDRLSSTPPSETPAAIELLARVLPHRLTVTDPGGTVLGDSVGPVTENHANRPEIRQALATGMGEATRPSATTGESLLYVALRWPAEGPLRGVVRVSRPMRQVDAATVGALAFTNRTAATALSAAVLLSLLAALMASRPLRVIARGVKAFAAGDFGYPINVTSNDEIGDAARSLAELSVQLRDKLATLGTDRAILRSLIDSLPVGVVLYDDQGVPVALNGVARALFELRPEVEDRRAAQLVTAPGSAKAIAEARENGSWVDTTLTVPWMPERPRYVRWAAGFAPSGEVAPMLIALSEPIDVHTSVPPAPVEVASLTDVLSTAVADARPAAEANGVRIQLESLATDVAIVAGGGTFAEALGAMVRTATRSASSGDVVRVRADVLTDRVRVSVFGPSREDWREGFEARVREGGGDVGVSDASGNNESWLEIPRA